MADANRCPTCGAALKPGQACPFCAEAQRLVAQLAEQEEVRLCARCGALLQPAEDEICDACRRTLRARALQSRREDRIARWLRDRFVETPAQQSGLACPSCGRPMPPLARFCPYCGHKMAQGPASVQELGKTAALSPDVAETAAAEAATASLEPIETAYVEAHPGLEATEEAVSAAVGAEVAEGAGDEGLHAQIAEPPGMLRRVGIFLQEQFQPFSEEWQSRGRVSLGERIAAFWRGLVRPGRPRQGAPTWLWAMLFVVLAGLVGMIALWAYLLSSGVRFH